MAFFFLVSHGSRRRSIWNGELPVLLCFILVAVVLFTVPAIIGFAMEPSKDVMHAPSMLSIDQWKLLQSILASNYHCWLLECCGVLTIGFVNLLTLCGNGLQFGMFLHACSVRMFFCWVAPHAAVELSSVVIGAGVSLRFTYAFARALLKQRPLGKRMWYIFCIGQAVSFSGITIAAFIEVYVTPVLAPHIELLLS